MPVVAVLGLLRGLLIAFGFSFLAVKAEKIVSSTGQEVNRALMNPGFIVAVLGLVYVVYRGGLK